MTLWKKTLLGIALSVGLLAVSLYVIQRYLVLTSFTALEQQYARGDVQRAVRALDVEMQRVDAVARDWAAWDDTYQFVQDGNEAYRRSNLGDQTFHDIGINLLLIADSSAQVVWSKALDLTTGEALLLPELSQQALQPDHSLLQHPGPDSRSVGIELLGSGPMIIASRPILNSDGEGPIRGTLLVGRFLDQSLLDQIAGLVGRPLEVRRVDDAALPADLRRAEQALAAAAGPHVAILDDNRVAAYGLIRDLGGNPALIVRTVLPRDIYAYGQISFRYLAAAIVLLGVLFWGVIVLLIERAVLARIGLLGRELSRVGGAGDLSQRVLLRGQDEVGRLADQVNNMLTDLQQAKDSIRWRERYLEGLAGAAQSLLAPGAEIHYAEFLRPLGEATHASRVGVFLNGRGMAGELVTSLKAEWCAPGAAPLLGNPKLHNLALVASGLDRAVEDLQGGLPVQGMTSEFLPRERAFLEGLDVQAIVLLPLLVDSALVGLLAFQQCPQSCLSPVVPPKVPAPYGRQGRPETGQTARPRLGDGETHTARQWEPAEVDLMRAASADLVQALQRKRKDKVQDATYRVSQAALAVESLQEFCRAVCGIVRELMPSQSFYVAVRDRASGVLAFRFVADGEQELAEPKGLGKELAEYVVRTGEPLLVPLDVFEKMRSQEASPSTAAGDWLGVPLKLQERVIGVLAVHSLVQGGRLGAEELDILNFVSGQVAMAVDRRQAEQEREGLQAQLGQVQRIDALGQMATALAHEFGDALTGILANADLALSHLAPSDPAMENVVGVRSAAVRASSLMHELQAAGGRQVLRPRPLDLNVFVQSMCDLLRRMVGQQVKLETELGHLMGRVVADPSALQQAVMSLAVFARDGMPDGGTLRIETAHVAVDSAYRLRRPEAHEGEFARLTISDTGAGMAEETLAHLFDPFAAGQTNPGNGLHLAAVYAVVRQHKGWIEVHSELGRGTEFVIYLPVGAMGTMEDQSVAEAEWITGGETVLLADDEEEVRQVTRRGLELAGYPVWVAENGRQAVELFQAHRDEIDLVILDAVMPEMSGPVAYEAMAALRPGVPVLFVTAYSSQMERLGFQQGPGRRVLHKPFSLDELHNSVRAVLEESKSLSRHEERTNG